MSSEIFNERQFWNLKYLHYPVNFPLRSDDLVHTSISTTYIVSFGYYIIGTPNSSATVTAKKYSF